MNSISIIKGLRRKTKRFKHKIENQTVEAELETSSNKQEYKDIVALRELTVYEKIDSYESSRYFLELTKAIMRIKAALSELCMKTVVNTFFEIFIMLVILMNVVTLALNGSSNNLQGPMESLELFYLIVYTIEAQLKILAYGFFIARGSYMRDLWNYIDIAIVISGWIDITMSTNGVKLTALRVLRILRPLRGITSIKGLRVIIRALFYSAKQFTASISLLIIFLLIFAVAGLQIWSGSLKWRCLNINTGVFNPNSCGSFTCEKGYECAYSLNNPNSGSTNFDNLLYSFLTVFQCITLEGWTDTMFFVVKVYNFSAIFFFVILVFTGAYLLISLTLVVIKSALTNSIKVVNSKNDADEMDELDTNDLAGHLKKLLMSNSEVFDISSSGVYSDSEMLRISEGSHREDKDYEEAHLRNHEENENENENRNKNRMSNSDEEDFASNKLMIKKISHFTPTAESGDQATNRSSGYKRSNSMRMMDFSTQGRAKRLENLYTLTPMISRMNSSIRVSKKLIAKLQSEGDLVPIIHYSDINSTSCKDVHPEDVISKFTIKGHSYVFSYRKSGENDYVKAVFEHETEKIELFYEHNKFLGGNQKILGSFSGKHSARRTFFKMKVNTKDFIAKVYKNDEFTLKIVADKSRVNYEKSCGALENSLSSMGYILFKKGPGGAWAKLTYPLQKFISNKYFNNTIYICIIANTIVLSIDYYGISLTLLSILNTMNTAFTFIFGAELLLRILSLGLNKFSRDFMNYLDFVIVASSLIEFSLLSGSKSVISAFRAVRIFKLMRVIRVAKLFRYLKSMSHIIFVISKSISKFAYVAILLFLFVIVYSLLGMEIFAGRLVSFRQSRSSFDNFYWAFLSIFQVLTIENWQNLLYDIMASSIGPVSAFFLVSWVFLGNFILLNLFLAILLDAFTTDEAEEEPVLGDPRVSRTMNSAFHRRSLIFKSFDGQVKKKREETLKMIDDLPDVSSESDVSKRNFDQDFDRFGKIDCERSYFIFSKLSKLRILCNKIANNERFEILILVIIAISSIKIVIETYTITSPDFPIIMSYIDLCLTLCFILEFLIKSINSGFAYDKGSYLNDIWNSIDFTIIVLSVIDLLLITVSFNYLKIFRLVRTFRALRFISHNMSMKTVIKALLQSIVAILNVVLVCLIIWIMFAIFGMSLFAGKLYNCSDRQITTMDECLRNGFEWESEFPNYDNLVNAMITLFIVSSEEGWPDIMYSAIDATDIGKAPERDYNPLAGLYFVFFIFFGTFFFMNLFIGVVFEQFYEASKHESSLASIILTKDQMFWIELQSLILKSTPWVDFSIPKTSLGKFCYTLTRHPYFEIFIMVCILLNMCGMAIIYDGASKNYILAIDISNLLFTFVFILEALLKIIGFRGYYFKSAWNRFDFLVAASSFIDLILTYAVSSSITLLRSGPQLLRVVKLLRISRLFRLFRSLRPLQTMLTIMKYSLPAIFNVLSLMLLIFFIYAVMGVYLFSDITNGNVINEYNNFSNFSMAMLVLFRCATGENWYLIMHDCAKTLGTPSSYIFFCSFISVSSFIMLNLFIMVILQNYDDYQSNPHSVLKVFNKDIRRFKNAWSLYSKGDGLRVNYTDLPDIMYELGFKFGISKDLPREKVLQFLSVMNLHIQHDGFVHYNDFLFAVMKKKYAEKLFRRADRQTSKIVAKENANTLMKLKMMRQKYYEDKMNSFKKSRDENFFIGMIYMKKIFKAWKSWVYRRRLRKHSKKSFESITPRFTEEDFPGTNSENIFMATEMNQEESRNYDAEIFYE